ncbi:uncharacterized protein LOC106078670 isoform X3 [Biomphalaria glabrata]|uniref:Uncharacterized protein LOC106078670 isoform X3 n=1 Tax=Biomphalaria glabrata TaxID=6526 RepID=A0A9W2ZA05_BIOGL|nr:uncharacterized protein LOC106078670 isoform X3 [Biomphalaria glabrata]
MPVGNSANKLTKSKKKDDVQQKVLEIKQRQQNWMKQRDISQKDEIKMKPQLPAANLNSNFKNEMPSSKTNVKTLSPDQKDKIHVREKFKHWIDIRNETKKNDDTGDLNDNLSIRSGAESELERLVSPEPDSRLPTQEHDFKNLAEKIANKVKEDLGLSQSSSSLSASTAISFSDSRTGSNHFNQEKTTSTEKTGLASHSCFVCKNLMISSQHVPMMVIPCGHTLCKTCSEKRNSCPSCDCPIKSLTINIMLQQVIQEYHTPKSKSTFKTLDRSSNSNNENKNYYLTYSSAEIHQPVLSYKTQLSSLQTRHDILSNEYETMTNSLGLLMKKFQQQHRQVQNIKTQEEEVEKAIHELQTRLAALKSHRAQYEKEVLELQTEKAEVDSKIGILKETLSSLEREIEKVRLYYLSLIP